MSVERVERKDGSVVWRVRWRQGDRNRSKVLGRKRDAEAFDSELIRRRRTGELAQLDAGKELLADFGEQWWRLHAEPNLARSTLNSYAVLWDAHVLPRIGSISLRELTPDVINRFRLELEADGVGPASVRARCRSARSRARRPAGGGRWGSSDRSGRTSPSGGFMPVGRRLMRCCSPAMTVSRGPRPPTATGAGRSRCFRACCSARANGATSRPTPPLSISSVRSRTCCQVSASASPGRSPAYARTQTSVASRGRRRSSNHARIASTRSGASGATERVRRTDGLRTATRRIYVPAAKAAGIERPRPYDLRHSFVSLLIAEGHNVVEVARQAGHSPAMALGTYAHVFEEFDPAERVSAADRIRNAREELRLRAQQPTLFDVA